MRNNIMHGSVIVNADIVASRNILIDNSSRQSAFLYMIQNDLLHSGGTDCIGEKNGAVQLVIIHQIKDIVFAGVMIRIPQHAAESNEMTDVDVVVTCKFMNALQDVMLVFFVDA